MQKLAERFGGQNSFFGASFLRLAVLSCAGFVFMASTVAHAQQAPLNDNFTNAIVISGLSGSTSGKNTSATLEAGETNAVFTANGLVEVGNSVWFQWTAPYSGNVTFDTIGSIDVNFNPMDTVLSAWTGASIATLLLTGANDNISSTEVNSSLTFYATGGQTYYVSVELNAGQGGQPGSYILNWTEQGAPIAGTFRLTSPTYTFSLNDGGSGTAEGHMRAIPARATVTRVGGASGMVDVGYSISTSYYTNYLITNIYTTNIITGSIDTNGVVVGATNYVFTIFNAIEAYQNYTPAAGYYYTTRKSSALFGLTNINGVVTGNYTNGLQFVTNTPAICGRIDDQTTTIDPTTGNTIITDISYSCTNVIVTNIISSAVGYTFPTGGILPFDDFQMNMDISIPFINASASNYYLENPLLFVTLNTSDLDPAEDQTIPPPVIQASRSVSTVSLLAPTRVPGAGQGDILDRQAIVDGLFLNEQAVPEIFGPDSATNNIINIERSTIRCSKTVNGLLVANVGVTITGSTAVARTAYYRIDYAGKDDNNDSFALQAGSDYARPDNATKYTAISDFTSVSGQLSWPQFDSTTKFIQIPISQDNVVKFNQDLEIELYIPNGVQASSLNAVYGSISTCDLTILYTTPAAGANDIAYNTDNNELTSPPYNTNPGANGVVYTAVVQPNDGKALIGGDFSAYNSSSGANRYYIARINTDGQLDSSFDPGSGFDEDVRSLTLDANNKVIVGGQFHSYNGNLRQGIARLNSDGSLDGSFDPGVGISSTVVGANSAVWTTAVQPDGQILIAGNFTTYNGTNRNYIARLNQNGSVDSSFDPGIGPNSDINSIAVQTNGQIVIGGTFTTVDGNGFNYIARLNSDGSLDTTFNPGYGFGVNNTVNSVAVQPDGKILVGGLFTSAGNQLAGGIVRFNADGSVDNSFVTGVGFSDEVNTINLQSNGTILVGGWFTSYNQTRRVGLARLLSNGVLDTSFMDTAYNQFAGVINDFYDPSVNPPNPIYTLAVQQDGNIIVGGSFSQIGGGGARDDIHPRQNVARVIGGVTPGPGNLELSHSSFSADSASPSFYVQVDRTNGTLGSISATVSAIPTGSGTGYAAYGVDYTFTPQLVTWGVSWADIVFNNVSQTGGGTWMLSDGLYGTNNYEHEISGNNFWIGYNGVTINIISNNNNTVSLDLGMTQPKGMDTFFLGGNQSGITSQAGVASVDAVEGENIPLGTALGVSLAPMTIVHNNPHPGVFNFSSALYYVTENAGSLDIIVTRTGGTDNNVSVRYATTNGTALANTDYRSVSGTLSFSAGQSTAKFTVPIINGTIARPDRLFNVTLSVPGGGASLGTVTNAAVEIVNNNFTSGHVEFAYGTTVGGTSIYFGTNENTSPLQVTLARLGGAVGSLNVTVATTNGTAKNGVNYLGFTNVISWTNGDAAPKTVYIPTIDDGLITTNLMAGVTLYNPIVSNTNAPQVLALSGSLTNAAIIITNIDASGQVEFTSSSYSVNENAGYAIIPVIRTAGSVGTLSVTLYTMDGTAANGVNYVGFTNTITFATNQVSTNLIVSIKDLGTANLSQLAFQLFLANIPGSGVNVLGSPAAAQMVINGSAAYNQPPGQPDTTYNSAAGFNNSVFALALQADGKLLAGGDFTVADGVARNRVARLNADGTLDPAFSSFLATSGANASVRTIAIQDNGEILLGGFFTNYNSQTLNYVARINLDGSVDASFNKIGAGANNPVYAIASTYVGGLRKVLLGGSFTLINGTPLNSIARLSDNGSVDATFNAGLGANATIYALAVQSDGKIIIGGDFTTVNGTNLNHIARLNSDGSVDGTFNLGLGANASVRAIAIQPDGRILIGGLFTSVNGQPLNFLARLNSSGLVDSSFNVGAGANGGVAAITVQPDSRILVVGSFSQCNGVTRNGITRLNSDGTVDPTINFGTGADGYVAAAVIESSGNIDLGGQFLNYNGSSHPYIVRINGGSIAGTGAFTFSSSSYQADENGSNALVSIIRTGGTSGTNANGSGNMYVQFSTSNGSAVAGTNYSMLVSNVSFAPGEVQRTISIPLFDDGVVTTNLTVGLTITNIPTSFTTIGSVPFATLYIINDDSSVNFALANYTVAKNSPSGVASINVLRNGSVTQTNTVTFLTTTNGTALTNIDYTPVVQTLIFNPGVSNQTVSIPINNNGIPEGNQTVTMLLTNFVGALPANPTNATLTIIDTVAAPGQLYFATNNYNVVKAGTNVFLTVLRTNGSSGIASVNYSTVAGTATPNFNYTPVTNGKLTFADGVTSATIQIGILDNNQAQGTVSFTVNLYNPQGGASLTSQSNAVVNIQDRNVGVSFQTATNFVSESISSGSVNVFVQRVGATNTAFSVYYSTTNYTAVPGSNYISIPPTQLNFASGQVIQSISIPIINNPRVTGDLLFGVNLSNPTAGTQLLAPSTTTVVILDANAGLSFTNATTSVLKSAGSLTIPVICSNPSVEPVIINSNTVPLQVSYYTTNGTATPGVDYTPVSGVLIFTNGIGTNNITVPIINNSVLEGNRTFNVVLASPTAPGQLIYPSTNTVTITDINSGVQFSSPTYSVLKTGIQATINVYRTGYTDSIVSVNYSTTNGTAIGNVNFVPVSGALTFTNGVTNQVFTIPIISSTVVQPDLTVFMQLFGATNATLSYPSFATLTIRDLSGSFVVPAGAVLVQPEGFLPANGIIDPGETNTIKFGFRASSGTNVNNLIATLLSANGVTSPSGSQTYGPLTVGGPSVSRPFTFTANGTNGQPIVATFKLLDGTNNLGTNGFTFFLGTWTTSYSNTAPIIINDFTTASPYPSSINISGLQGVVLKTTVTLTNLSHTSPGDIEALVVSPNQQDTLIMANAGAGNIVKNVTLTFDDAASTNLPQFNQIFSGTNKPTRYPTVHNFP